MPDYTYDELTKIAEDAARTYGVPEDLFLNQMLQESGLDPNVKVHYVTDKQGKQHSITGVAQFYDDTAAGLGVDPTDPIASLYTAAKYMRTLADKYNPKIAGLIAQHGGDVGLDKWDLALSAYNAGEGTVDQATEVLKQTEGGAGTFVKLIPDETKSYLSKIRGGQPQEDPNAVAKAAKAALRPQDSATKLKDFSSGPPSLSDYTSADGTQDIFGYQDALTAYGAWQDARAKDRSYQLGPLSQYVDDVIQQMQLEISSGNMQVSKAGAILDARVNSYGNALKAMEGDAFKYAAPAGAEYVPGRAPGDYSTTTLGLAPLKATSGNQVNPMEEALATYNDAVTRIGGVKDVSIPNIANMRQPGGVTPSTTTPPATTKPPGVGKVVGNVVDDLLKKALEQAGTPQENRVWI